MKGYITNLGAYNDGYLIGKWLDFPVSDNELAKAKKEIHINEDHEEFFFADWDEIGSNVSKKLGEYPDLALCNKLAEMNDDDFNTVEIIVSDMPLNEAIEIVSNGDFHIYYDCKSMAEVAMEFAEEACYLVDVPETVKYYIDYEDWGKDLEIDGEFYYDKKNRCYIEVIRR